MNGKWYVILIYSLQLLVKFNDVLITLDFLSCKISFCALWSFFHLAPLSLFHPLKSLITHTHTHLHTHTCTHAHAHTHMHRFSHSLCGLGQQQLLSKQPPHSSVLSVSSLWTRPPRLCSPIHSLLQSWFLDWAWREGKRGVERAASPPPGSPVYWNCYTVVLVLCTETNREMLKAGIGIHLSLNK